MALLSTPNNSDVARDGRCVSFARGMPNGGVHSSIHYDRLPGVTCVCGRDRHGVWTRCHSGMGDNSDTWCWRRIRLQTSPAALYVHSIPWLLWREGGDDDACVELTFLPPRLFLRGVAWRRAGFVAGGLSPLLTTSCVWPPWRNDVFMPNNRLDNGVALGRYSFSLCQHGIFMCVADVLTGASGRDFAHTYRTSHTYHHPTTLQ